MGKMAEKETLTKVDEIEWIPKSIIEDPNFETAWPRLKRKCRESPFVPLGIAATIGALCYGLYNFYHDRQMKQQYSMRARVTFQGLTLAAIVYSMLSESKKRMDKKKEQKS